MIEEVVAVPPEADRAGTPAEQALALAPLAGATQLIEPVPIGPALDDDLALKYARGAYTASTDYFDTNIRS